MIRRRILPALALTSVFAFSAAIASVSADPAIDIAKVYLGPATMAATLQKQSHIKVAYCLRTGQIDAGRARTIDQAIDRYQSEIELLLPDMQKLFAGLIRPQFTAEELSQTAEFFDSSAGRSFMYSTAVGIAEAEINTTKFCPNPAAPRDSQLIVTDAIAKLTPSEYATFKAFAVKPVVKKIAILTATVSTVRSQSRDKIEAAGKRSGFTESLVQ